LLFLLLFYSCSTSLNDSSYLFRLSLHYYNQIRWKVKCTKIHGCSLSLPFFFNLHISFCLFNLHISVVSVSSSTFQCHQVLRFIHLYGPACLRKQASQGREYFLFIMYVRYTCFLSFVYVEGISCT
jgi:hypothetical protein